MINSVRTLTKTAAVSLLATAACFASTSVSFSYSGQNNLNELANATTTFVWSGTGVLTVTVQNLVADQVDVGQAVSGVKFTLAGLTTTSPTESGTGDLITVAGNNTFTDPATQVDLSHWTASTSLSASPAAGNITLTTIGGGHPVQTILGVPDGSGYNSANGSIAGNGPHNPFVDQTATFTFSGLTGVNTSADIATLLSGVQIGFGTAGTDYVNTTTIITATPEPSTFWLLGLAMVGVAWAGRRRFHSAESK